MKHLPRIELLLALAALALALIAGLYLVITTFAQHQTCYGISADNIKCHAITGDNLAQTAARVAVSLSTVLAIFLAGALCAWAQGRARKPDSRLTAYMGMLTCALIALGITLPAVSGVGFFFIPSTVLILLASLAGIHPLIETYRGGARKV
ncbi:MAG: hypothetical protein ACHQ4H_09135 [Ktedonobacterales bacterium]